jgi:hypothetical protein
VARADDLKLLGGTRLGFARAAGVALVALSIQTSGCFDSGDGTEPPPNRFNYPVGIVVSPGGSVLYAVNSNFDLEWNAGNVQAYDLNQIREDTRHLLDLSQRATFPVDHLVDPNGGKACGIGVPPQGSSFTLGIDQCRPPAKSEVYFRRNVLIGAFATDLQASPDGTRLFTPVRGDASLTWLTTASDANGAKPADPFMLDCGQGSDKRCNAAHRAGNNKDEPGNSRHLTMPGEPFGMALSERGDVAAGDFALITHQTDTKTSLLRVGPTVPSGTVPAEPPSLQFVVDGVTGGGIGIAAVPHDQDAFEECIGLDLVHPDQNDQAQLAACRAVMPRPAFIQTSRAAAKIDLLRLYEDEGFQGGSQPSRPFLQRETEFVLDANAGNFDSRGIAIDRSPRIACKRRIPAILTGPERDRQIVQCARLPARVYIANRAPASLLIGEIGEPSNDGESYNPDQLTVRTSIPLSFGPSRVYVGPVVETDGTYGLRIFILCFDSSTIYVFDPNANIVENLIHVGDGPFAMAFDPFTFDEAATNGSVQADADANKWQKYRFAYVGIFRNSHVQVIDLDNSVPRTADTKSIEYTYQNVVFNLGQPIAPKGGL